MNNVANDVRQSIVDVIANIQQKVVGYQAQRQKVPSDRPIHCRVVVTRHWLRAAFDVTPAAATAAAAAASEARI